MARGALDGRAILRRLVNESKLVEVSFQLAEGGAVRDQQKSVQPDTGLFLPLDVKHIARPGAMKDASVSLKPGMQQIKAVPMIVGDAASGRTSAW